MSTVPSKVSPKLLDVACDAIATKLGTRLTWLTNTYGRCEVFEEERGTNVKNVKNYPVIYTGNRGRDYLKLMPDSGLGNFMFIDVSPIQELDSELGELRISTQIGIIFWFNYEEVYPNDHRNRTVENIKFDILDAVRKGGFGSGVRFEIEEVVEGAKQVYSSFTNRLLDAFDHQEGKNSYMKRPYGGIRVNGTLRYAELCF